MTKIFLPFLILLLQCNFSFQTECPNCEARTCLPSSCADIRMSGSTRSGIYTVYPKHWYNKTNITVYCDMETDGGGWTVIQRRDKYEMMQSFIENWNSYQNGFGDLNRDFWLGNDNIHILTSTEYVSLRVDLVEIDGIKNFALYNQFLVKGCHDRYRLILGEFSGTTDDGLTYHNGATFVTFEDGDVNRCSLKHKGGWWYKSCRYSNLNGVYTEGSTEVEAITWQRAGGQRAILKSEMKIRPQYFTLSSK